MGKPFGMVKWPCRSCIQKCIHNRSHHFIYNSAYIGACNRSCYSACNSTCNSILLLVSTLFTLSLVKFVSNIPRQYSQHTITGS